MARVFDFTLVIDQGPNDSHWKVIKVLNPTLELWVVPDCPVCEAVREFFEEQGVDLKIQRGNTRTMAKPARKSIGKSAEYPIVQYHWAREIYPVPLPKLHDGASPATLQRRLRDMFVQRVPSLREHQKDLHRAFESRDIQQRNTPAFTVKWEMGSGKTLGATSLMVNHRSRYNVILCGNTNIEYWVDHLRRTPFITQQEVERTMGAKKTTAGGSDLPEIPEFDDLSSTGLPFDVEVDNRSITSRFDAAERDVVLWFEVVGYTAFKAAFDSERALREYDCAVVDEAHHYRNNTMGMSTAIEALHSARNVVLLTGTPLVNDASDVVGMLSLSDMDNTRDWEAEFDEDNLPSPTVVQAFFKGHVSWFDPKTHRPNMFKRHYPTLVDHPVRVEMTWPQTLQYLMAIKSNFELGEYIISQGRSNRYNCLTRAACNAPEDDPTRSPKLLEAARIIFENKANGAQLVHSSLLDNGVFPLRDICVNKLKMDAKRVGMVTGMTPNAQRDENRKRYNKNKLDVMFISDASQFGMDLHKTWAVHLIEPHNNAATEAQTTARAVRMGSHRQCKRKEVDRYRYFSVFPSKPPSAADVAACKEYLIRHKKLGRDTGDKLEHIDLGKEMWAKVREVGETINERQAQDNLVKAKRIEPYDDAYRRASVFMSKQKGAKLFADEPVVVKEKKRKDSTDGGTVSKRSKAAKGSSKAASNRFTYNLKAPIPAIE